MNKISARQVLSHLTFLLNGVAAGHMSAGGQAYGKRLIGLYAIDCYANFIGFAKAQGRMQPPGVYEEVV